MNKEQIEEKEEVDYATLDMYKILLQTKLQRKLDSLNVESASTEANYCQILGFSEGIKFCLETIKNT